MPDENCEVLVQSLSTSRVARQHLQTYQTCLVKVRVIQTEQSYVKDKRGKIYVFLSRGFLVDLSLTAADESRNMSAKTVD